MRNYIGSKCIACGTVFDTGDDIVVCPDCGTPYHRDCYFKIGRCINTDLHESGEAWKPDNMPEPTVEEQKTVRCIRCGAENPMGEHVCSNCGTPLVNMQATRPTFDGQQPNVNNNAADDDYDEEMHAPNGAVMYNQDSEIEGIKLGDYARYVGTNPIGYLPNFIRFGKYGRKISLNFFAMFFPELYFMYRKMKLWGILAVVVFSLLSVPTMIEMYDEGFMGMKLTFGINVKSHQFVSISNAMRYMKIVLQILSGLFANYLYYQQAKKDITRIRSENYEDDVSKLKIIGKGGTSWANVLLAFTLSSMLSLAAIWAMASYAG